MAWRFLKFKLIYPVVLLLFLFVDGDLMASMGPIFTHFPLHILPTLTLIWLFYAIQFEATNLGPYWVYVVGIGLLFDIYYTGFIGTYTVAYLASTVLMYQLRSFFDERMMSGLLLFLIGLVTYLVVTYVTGFIINIADISLTSFLTFEVLPTAILNLALAALGYYPTWSFFQKLS
ncbi:rod shape-determining protein MreD [Leuconostocaceae bacterium ESL0723]|nr:rod shape-determining protein MreD [Leuconostocaceae bacterium ESL0723]